MALFRRAGNITRPAFPPVVTSLPSISARRPVAVGDAIAIHHMSILGFSYDHRAFDGSTASLFLRYIRDAIQDRGWDAELS